MLSDTVIAWIRTVVPAAVSSALLWIGTLLGIEIDTEQAVMVVLPIVIGAYYAAARWVERRFPAFGRFLVGPGGAPSYKA